jgi:uncharacterized membrane protein YcaP (DUF421 family)
LRVFDVGADWWQIVVRTAVVYVALIVGFRLTGKRQIGQMAPFDLVVILLIANAVQNAMVGPDTSLTGGLLAAGILLGVNWIAARYISQRPPFARFFEGEPAVLIADGRIAEQNVRREGVDMAELEQAAREHGIESLEQVKMAVLEVDGTISIVPADTATVRTKRRFRTRPR